MTKPIAKAPARVRQRPRAGGAWRIWWEPETAIRALGFEPVELDPARLTWSVREAERLNDLVDQARGGGLRADKTATRTVAALIHEYRSSPFWQALKLASQRDYAASFRLIETKWGSTRVADFSKSIVLEWYEALYRTGHRHQAAALIRKLSVLMSYAVLREWIELNPCSRLRLKTPKGRNRVAHWSELDALLDACQALELPSIGLAIALAVFQGQRQADLVAARRSDVRLTVLVDGAPSAVPFTSLAIDAGGAIVDALGRPVVQAHWLFLRSKRGNLGGLELCRDVLEAMTRIAPSAEPQLLVYEGTGRAYSGDLFRKAWARVRAGAAATDPETATLQFRDLRRTFGHLARLGGASERDVADALGNNAWKDPELSGTYMPANADTASRAVAAISRPTTRS